MPVPDQGLFEAGQPAQDLVGAIAERHLSWEERTGEGDRLAADGAPRQEYRDMVSFLPHP